MNETKATRYQRLRRRARTAAALSAALMLAVVALTPVGGLLSRLAHAGAAGLTGPAEATVALCLFVLLVVLLWEVASLPGLAYLALKVDRRFGRPAESVEDVLSAQLHATVLAAPAVFAAGAVVLVAMYVFGAWWWIAAGVVLAIALAGALHVGPSVLAGLGELRPVTREGLAERLASLADGARAPVSGIAEWVVSDSAGPAALVAGVGRRRRILLSSELVRQWSDDEIAVVVAHELAHHVYRDLWRTLALDVLVLWAGLLGAELVLARAAGGAALLGQLAALPIVAFVALIVWAAATPIRHAQSRRHERRADIFALAMTGGAESFGMAIRRLGARHLAEERPSALTRWLYHRHPTVAERLAMAEAYRRLRPET